MTWSSGRPESIECGRDPAEIHPAGDDRVGVDLSGSEALEHDLVAALGGAVPKLIAIRAQLADDRDDRLVGERVRPGPGRES
ncbi:hypothetical protein GTA09_21010 [Rhodococcus hoagii]|nr:hypothetical protein [Prescottella equi]